MSDRRFPNLTALEQRAIGAAINLSDGHPRQDPTPAQAAVVAGLPGLFELARTQPFATVERRAQATFLGMLGQSRAPVTAGGVFSVYSSSVATMAVANALTGRRVALVHPTFDNIYDILVRRLEVVPLSEDALAAGDVSSALAAGAGCVFVTTPNNPTGWVMGEAALRRVAADCAAHGLVLVLDVSFRGFDPRAQFDHYAVLDDAGVEYVVIEDTGKLWPMQELKLAFVAVGGRLRPAVELALSDVLLTVSPFLLALVERLSVDARDGGLAQLHRLIARNRRIVAGAVEALDDVTMPDPDSRISVARLRLGSAEQADLARAELRSRGVHVLPCRQFFWADPEAGAPFVRVALARNATTLAEGMRRLVGSSGLRTAVPLEVADRR